MNKKLLKTNLYGSDIYVIAYFFCLIVYRLSLHKICFIAF